jgi:hypothetical protein
MIERLRNYVLRANNRRWANDSLSIFAGVVWSLFARHAVSKSAYIATIEGAVVTTAGIFLTTILYVAWPKPRPQTGQMASGSRRLVTSVLSAAIITALALSTRTVARTLPRTEINRIAVLPEKQFSNELPRLQRAISVADSEGVGQPATLTEVRSRLAKADESSPGFWEAATSLISYESPRVGNNPLPNCITPFRGTFGPDGRLALLAKPYFESCLIEIDDPHWMDIYALLAFVDVEFRNCQIVYNGRPIVFPQKSVGRLVFKNCQFDMVPSGSPPPSGKRMITALLSAPDLKLVDLPNPSDPT